MTATAFQQPATFQAHPQLRRHKVLPRPRNDRKLDDALCGSSTLDFRPVLEPVDSQPSSPHVLKHEPRRMGPGPDPPPTPPNHSRNSSESTSVLPFCPSAHGSLPTTYVGRRPVATPPDQRSLPTPDVTPPGPVTRSRALRSSASERGSYKVTATESLTESFMTAREAPSLSDDDSSKSALRRSSPSIALSHRAAARPLDPRGCQTTQPRDLLDLALNQIQCSQGDTLVSRARGPVTNSDADVSSPTQVEHKGYYDLESSPNPTTRRGHETEASSSMATSFHAEPRHISGHSRQQTLRHVQKRGRLREPDIARHASADEMESTTRMTHALVADFPERQIDQRSTGHSPGTSFVASGRARRQVWEDGGIPVVVVPDRRSSGQPKPKREPSLRSTSSRPSRKTTSCGSDSSGGSREHDKQSGRGRTGDPRAGLSDQRKDDGPLHTPALCSSISASTTLGDVAESVRAPETYQQRPRDRTSADTSPPKLIFLPEMDMPSPTLIRFEKYESQDLLNLGRHDDALSAKKYSSRNTPFSIASFETAPEVSEAMAVHMYPHQNSSLLVVDHLAKSLETADSTVRGTETEQILDVPLIRTTCPNGGPVTPPQQMSSDEADSPLRNPRPPPTPPKQPPAINLIPATPSGRTPSHEKLIRQGNYFEVTSETPPSRRPSLVKRALGRRRNSIDCPPAGASRPPGLLARTLSLSRNVRHSLLFPPTTAYNPDAVPVSVREETAPAEQGKLHPFWRPHPVDEGSNGGRGVRYRDLQADDWPRAPRRTLSARMKRTFAIFPLREDDYHSADIARGPERRTIRRSPSGSLRVMRRPSSVDSLLRRESWRGEPWSAPGARSLRSLWRGHSLRSRRSEERRQGSRLERMPTLPRIMSERKRAKRSQELRQMISGPKDVRDGVREVIEPKGARKKRPSEAEALDLI
ncbi:hypothetical protein XA68_14572 [Ophiocordyceps unilateralis]|uniref:Uncharacterized protein n=1 Tax=Ophiocordyceps unilateralis TaxID=268505 RepID=A0A2A9P992_OPHUN|nr:hypothetical protein XA68_14572 [Ophiocordyceps unilateralis]